MKIKVIYTGHNETIDTKITKTLVAAGFKWTGQGRDLTTRERDICFEIEPQNDKSIGES